MKNNSFLWAILTISMVMIVLFFGLLPRKWPIANDLQYLSDQRGIRFQNTGIAYVDDLTTFRHSLPWPLTIEMAVTASIDRRGFSPLLVMHDGADRRQLAIWQYGTSLIVMNGDDYSNKQRRPRIVGKNVFIPQRTSYLTITSGEQGTHLYVDGVLSAANSNWKLSIPIEGDPLRLVLGHSVYGKYGWAGDLHGLAISGEAISGDVVRRRFDRWAAGHNFDFFEQESTMLLFTFGQKSASPFVDQSGKNNYLKIPQHMIVLQKTILASTWRPLNWNRAVVGDMVVNVVGFMPLGIVFYGFLQCFSGSSIKHKQLIAVALSMLLSFGIELAQAWIPTRYSTLLDLILNTLGAWLGIVGWRLIGRAKGTRMHTD